MKTLCRSARRRVSPLFLFACSLGMLVPAQASFETTFVPRGATGWKFLIGGPSQGTAWRDLTFNDSTWTMRATPAPIGYGDPLPTQEPQPGTPRPITMYMRMKFTVTPEEFSQVNALVLRCNYDDGAVAYLNGVEMGRYNMPEGVIAFGTPASGNTNSEIAYDQITLGSGFTTDNLVEGENILALEIHQVSTGSSDTRGDAELIGQQNFPDYGRFTPNSAITFEDASESDLEFLRLNEFETDLDWECTEPTGSGIGGVFFLEPLQGFLLASQEWTIYGGLSNFMSGRIDTRNYVDVRVTFEAKTTLVSPATFDATVDQLRLFVGVSRDGDDFSDEVEAADLRGTPSTASTNILVASTDMKTVRVPTNNSENTANPNWREMGFDDSSWHEGINGTGFEGTPNGNPNSYAPLIGIDVQSEMRSRTASVYMRVPFEAPDPATINNLSLLMKYDDGFVAYLNGMEIARRNAPGTEGTPLSNTDRATTSHPDDDATVFEVIDIDPFINLLVHNPDNGEPDNLLAIHGLNAGTGSSDMVILPELHAGVPSLPPDNLNDMAGPPDGPLHTYGVDIPDNAESIIVKFLARTSDSLEQIFVDNIRITGTPLAVDSYDTYIQKETSLDLFDEGLPLADADGDGIVNFLEYAFGSDPEVASFTTPEGRLIKPRVETVNTPEGPKYRMTFRMLNLARTGSFEFPEGGYTVRDLKYIPQVSTSMDNWDDGFSGPSEVDEISIVDNDEDGTVDVTVEFKTPHTGEDEFFVRLMVERVLP